MLDVQANRAARLGPARFPWWKDWRGGACAIIASGPSAKGVDYAGLRGRLPVLAIKETAVDLCPWADVAYGCDAPWWVFRRGLPDFKGVKIAWAASACDQFRDLHKVEIKDINLDELLLEEPMVIGSGGNSGFQALNIAVQFGASRIMLIGFDMQDRSGVHYYGRNTWARANNPSLSNFQRWKKAFDAAASTLSSLGVEVVNAAQSSALKCFPKCSVEQTLTRWRL